MSDEQKTGLRSSFIAHRSSLAILAAVALVLFLRPLVAGEVFTLRDHFDYFQPLRWFTADELLSGRVPLWNPYNASGEPWLANPQTGIFYPPAWLFLFLPFATAYTLFLFFHVALLGWGAYLYFSRTASPGAALVGAVALMCSGPVLSLLDVNNNLATLAWIPLALWCAAEGAWRRGGIVLALAFLGGEPFFAAVGAGMYAVQSTSRRVVASSRNSSRRLGDSSTGRLEDSSTGRLGDSSTGRLGDSSTGRLEDSSSRRLGDSSTGRLEDSSSRRLGDSSTGRLGDSSTGRLLAAAMVAFGLSAVQLFPFLDFLRRSDRAAGLDESLILMHSMSLRDWMGLVVPSGGTMSQQFIPVVYVGVVVCVLACIAAGDLGWRLAVGGWRWGGRGVAPANRQSQTANALWLALFAIAFVISLGPSLLAQLPLTLFRYPARLVPLAALAIAALAVSGWDRVRPQRRWLDFAVVLLVVVDLVPRAWPLLHSEPFRADVVPYPRAVGAETKFLRVGTIDPRNRAAWISGYLNLYDRRFDAFTAAPVATDAYVRTHSALQARPSGAELARKGIGWVVTAHDLRVPPAARAGGVSVYANRDTFPMAYLIVREPLTTLPLRVRLDTSSARVSVDAPREGVVVVLQQHDPGWRVWIDGLESRSVVVDKVFRGVQVTRGHHEVVWKYRPRALFFGALVTSLTLLAMTLARFVKRV